MPMTEKKSDIRRKRHPAGSLTEPDTNVVEREGNTTSDLGKKK